MEVSFRESSLVSRSFLRLESSVTNSGTLFGVDFDR